MKLKQISIQNFRKMYKKVSMDLNFETLIVGKNNTAKTSIFELINKFTSNLEFRLEDFNYNIIKDIYIEELLQNYDKEMKPDEQLTLLERFPFIELDFNILINDEDNLALVKELIYEFDNNSEIIIKCKYSLDNLNKIYDDYFQYNSIIEDVKNKITFNTFFKRNFQKYYSKKYYSTKPDETYLNRIEKEYVFSIFNIYTIYAQRNVDDTSDNEKLTLSNAIWKFYQKKKKEQDNILHSNDLFKKAIDDIKTEMNNSYQIFFSDLVGKLNNKIVNDDDNRNLQIVSDFDIENILKQNSKIKYFIEDNVELTESYNGLGYSNLLYMFIQIEAYKFEMLSSNAIFNILFIEEPESHLHPQMQAVFLKKLKDTFLNNENVYKVITTHSSYILQSSNIESIRYFLNKDNSIYIKSLSEFVEKYEGLSEIIKKYFRINTCDLFFADKAILIEGSAERILLPSMLELLDEDVVDNKISEQHISIFEVGGTYGYIFEELLRFLEIRGLTITDIDSVCGNYNNTVMCDISGEPDTNTVENPYKIKTINSNITSWFKYENKPLYIKTIFDKYQDKSSRIKKIETVDKDGNVIKINECHMITFQLPINKEKKIGRTFEEQFIIENSEWIKENIEKLESLHSAIKNAKNEKDVSCNLSKDNITKKQLEENFYYIVEKLKKTDYALEIVALKGWKTPNYIKEGLEWLRN